MGWPASLGIAALSGLSAMLLAGWTANLAVEWYRISSFEGKAGYFVVGMALLGLIAGIIIGLVASRVVAGGAYPSVLRGLLGAEAVVLGVVGGVALTARLLADVPPRFNGEVVHLAVEIAWPPGEVLPPATDMLPWFVQLHSSVGRTVRASQAGPLWRADARQEDGRWIVPGVVSLFTGRGDRVITVRPEGLLPTGFQVPLPARPRREHLEWSEWLPRARPGDAPLPEGFRYRFRAVPASQPIRDDTVGPFTIQTRATSVGEHRLGPDRSTWTADGRFVVVHGGSPVAFAWQDPSTHAVVTAGHGDEVAIVAGPRPTLLVQVSGNHDGPCFLVSDSGGALVVADLGPCGRPRHAAPLTEDPARFAAARDRSLADGQVDRETFAEPGRYHLRALVLDTRNHSVRRYDPSAIRGLIERIPPLGVAPDGLSLARLAWDDGNDGGVVLAVYRLDGGEGYTLPIDRARMRYGEIDQIDPAWLAHHYAWRRQGGADRLEERGAFTPLPWRGTLTLDYTGYREYRLAPAREGLREALVAFLVEELGGEALPATPDAYAHEVRIGEAVVKVSWSARDGQVGVWMDRGTDAALVVTIAERFDAALATFRYDHLLGA